MNDETEKPVWDGVECEDEKHIAAAMYLLHKAIALREQPDAVWPTIHACLRDAAAHCEAARKWWTKERVEELAELSRRIFGEEDRA